MVVVGMVAHVAIQFVRLTAFAFHLQCAVVDSVLFAHDDSDASLNLVGLADRNVVDEDMRGKHFQAAGYAPNVKVMHA